LIRVGVQQKVAMTISGHKTAAIFQRYNIVEAGRTLNEKQSANALLEIPFGQGLGINEPKTARSEHSEAAPQLAPLPG
jgi:hypothetical protein